MNTESKRSILFYALTLSLMIHGALFLLKANIPKFQLAQEEVRPLRIKSIRVVGDKSRNKKNLMFLKAKQKPVQKPSLKNLSFQRNSLSPLNSKEVQNSTLKKKKIFKHLNISKNQVKQFLKSPGPRHLPPSQALNALGGSDVNIQLEVPKGIPEDELNKHELVFYSFQKRTVMAYVNSFQKELNDFERANPHLSFPLSKEPQKMAGRVIYDKNGDIIRIETLRWSNIKRLQTFFMDVLKNMTSLPNPPKEILKNDQFAINFILSIDN